MENASNWPKSHSFNGDHSTSKQFITVVNLWYFFFSYSLKHTLAELKRTCLLNWPISRSNFFYSLFQIVVMTKNISVIRKQFVPVKYINSVREYHLCKSPYRNNCAKTIIRDWFTLLYAIDSNCNLEWADNKGCKIR